MEQNKNSEDLLKETKKLHQEVKRLREDIDQSYYSIPKKEFETVTVKRITQEAIEQLNKRIAFWRNLLFIVFAILSFLGYTQWSGMREGLKTDIETKVLERTEVFLSDTKEKISKLESELDDRLNKSEQDLKREAINAAVREAKTQFEAIRKDIKLAQKTALNTELTTLINKVDSGMLRFEKAIDQINPLLQKAIELKDKKLVEDFLDVLSRWTFLKTSYEDLDKLRVKYEKDYEFQPTTWANIAIGDMFLYEEIYSPTYKKKAFEACDKALESLPGYGEPYAVKLIIHTIDYERQKDQGEKESAKREALLLFNIINSGGSPVTANEAFNYFNRVKNIPHRINKYVKDLFQNYPEEMELMSERSKEYIKLLEERKGLIK